VTDAAEERSVVADAALSSRLAGAYVRWMLRRPVWLVIETFAVVALFVAAGIAVTTREATLLVLVALWDVLIVGIVAWSYLLTRSNVRRSYPAGSTIGIRLDDHAFHTTSALGTSSLSYTAFRDAIAVGDAVLLRMRSGGPGVALYPRSVFPGDDLTRLQGRIASTHG
jgi:hypothetical protein